MCVPAGNLWGEQPPAGKRVSKNSSIRITSDMMEAFDRSGKVVFSGHVKARREDMTINADTLTVYYEGKGDRAVAEGARRIKRLVANGHVKITQKQKIATGHDAVYDKPAEKITLSGDAQVWQGANHVAGDEIILFLNEDRSIVKSNTSKKVEAVVFTQE